MNLYYFGASIDGRKYPIIGTSEEQVIGKLRALVDPRRDFKQSFDVYDMHDRLSSLRLMLDGRLVMYHSQLGKDPIYVHETTLSQMIEQMIQKAKEYIIQAKNDNEVLDKLSMYPGQDVKYVHPGHYSDGLYIFGRRFTLQPVAYLHGMGFNVPKSDQVEAMCKELSELPEVEFCCWGGLPSFDEAQSVIVGRWYHNEADDFLYKVKEIVRRYEIQEEDR